jgi:hypothetical protein
MLIGFGIEIACACGGTAAETSRTATSTSAPAASAPARVCSALASPRPPPQALEDGARRDVRSIARIRD